jgi:Uma2 family endonuclease
MATIQQAQQPRVVLRDISWETYESLLADHADRSAPHFTYDRGTLEIVSPLSEHEGYVWALERLVEVVSEHIGLDFANLRSTTFKREDLQRGFEPDSCFYFQHAAAMQGKRRIDLPIDPAPELTIEVDITHDTLWKLPVLAEFGVQEVWRYDGDQLDMWVLEGARYVQSVGSRALPVVTAAAISTLMTDGKQEGLSGIYWLRRVRAWTRTLP